MSRLQDDSPRHHEASGSAEAAEYECSLHGNFVARNRNCPDCGRPAKLIGTGMTKKAFGSEDVDLRKAF